MLSKIFFFLLFTSQLFSQIILLETYEVNSKKIYLKNIIPTTLKNELLFSIDANKHSKRIKSIKLKNLLKKLGIKDIKTSSRYIKFQLRSPADTTIIETFLRQHYLQRYKTLSIEKITVTPRGYIDSLPEDYIIEIRDKSYLSRFGVVNIKDAHNKKVFFNYSIRANIKVVQTREKIRRGEKLSFGNTKYITIQLDKFKSTPIMNLTNNTLQTKRQVKKSKVLTIRDVESLDLVHKNSQVIVSLYNNGIYITFSAKTLQNGKLGDIITIQKSDLKRLKAKVIGKNKVELR